MTPIRENLAHTYIAVYGLAAIDHLCGAAYSLLVFKLLSVEDVGLYSWAIAIAGFFALAVDWGQQRTLPRVFGQNLMSYQAAFRFVLTSRGPIVLLGGAILAVLYRGGFLAGEKAAVLSLVGLVQVWMVLQAPSLSWLRANDRQILGNMLGVLMRSGRLLVAIFLAVSSLVPFNLITLLTGVGVVSGLVMAVSSGVTSTMRSQEAPVTEGRTWLLLGRPGAVFTILGILTVVQNRLDWLLVYGWLSAAELANYAVAYRLYDMIQGILGIGYGMIYVWLCRVGAGEQSDRLLSLARVTMFGGVCISWAGVLAGPEALRLLWGMKYASAELLVRLLLGTATLSAIIGLFYYVLLIEGREARLLPIAVVATSLQVLFDLVAIPTLGVLGAAFGMMVLILSTGLGYVVLIRESARAKTMGVRRILFASAAQFVIGWILLLSVPGPGWRLVLLLVCSLGCGYSLLLDARERFWFKERCAGVWHEMLMGQSGRGSE